MPKPTQLGRATIAIVTPCGDTFALDIYEAPYFSHPRRGRWYDLEHPGTVLIHSTVRRAATVARDWEAEWATDGAPAWHTLADGQRSFAIAPKAPQRSLLGG